MMTCYRFTLIVLACAAAESSVCQIRSVESVRDEFLSSRFAGASLETVDDLINMAVDARWFPAAAVAAGRRGTVEVLDGYGTFTYDSPRPVTEDTPFGLASLTKVIATTAAAMLLYENDKLDLNASVSTYLDAFDVPDKRDITIRHLLTHTSGLEAYITFYREGKRTRAAILDSIFTGPLRSLPGDKYTYSDFGMITLALVIEKIAGMAFDDFTREHIFEPLGMYATGFRGTGKRDPDVVPTEWDMSFRNRLVQGEVHDENAWILGGVSGHAGLFSTAYDLSRFARMMSQEGILEGERFLDAATIQTFTAVQDKSLSTRALGWDTKSLDKPSSAGQLFGPHSYGHTGFTGTSIWIDPDSDTWVVILTNRVYPTRRNYAYTIIRPAIAEVVYASLVGVQHDWDPVDFAKEH